MANIPGTAGDDVLSGTIDIDTIDGLAGNDVIAGLDGADGLTGGPGNNIIVGGRGDDTMVGGDDNDIFIWNNGDGNDLGDGSLGSDVQIVNGAAAAGDQFRVDPDASGALAVFQRVNLGPFSVTTNNVETFDVRGLAGDDSFVIADLRTTDVTQVVFRGGSGADVVDASRSRTSVVIFGEADNDILVSGLGNDWVDGGTGADRLIYAGGVDTFLIELADTVQVPGRTSARAFFGEGSLVLDFGGGNILNLQWQPGAFTGQQYYQTYLSTLPLV